MNYPNIPIGGTPATPGLPPTNSETTGGAVAQYDLVAFDTNGEIVPAISTTASQLFEVVGVVQAAGGAATAQEVVEIPGVITPMRFVAAPGAATNGDAVFLDSVAGQATLTAPTGSGNTVFRVGIMYGADGVSLTPDVLWRPDFVVSIP